jgi:hypothetical protein
MRGARLEAVPDLNQKCERLWTLLGTAERSDLNYGKQKACWRKQPARLHNLAAGQAIR